MYIYICVYIYICTYIHIYIYIYTILQYTATQCNAPQHSGTHGNTSTNWTLVSDQRHLRSYRHTLIKGIWGHTVTHCNPLQCTAALCSTLQHFQFEHWITIKGFCVETATPCNILHHAATHCNTLQHIATPQKFEDWIEIKGVWAHWAPNSGCVAVCCIVLQCVAVCLPFQFEHWITIKGIWVPVLQCVALCCSVLQYIYLSNLNIGLRSKASEFIEPPAVSAPHAYLFLVISAKWSHHICECKRNFVLIVYTNMVFIIVSASNKATYMYVSLLTCL